MSGINLNWIHSNIVAKEELDVNSWLFWSGRLWYWTILRWEILLLDFLLWEIVVLDYFAVGDSTAGLFAVGDSDAELSS